MNSAPVSMSNNPDMKPGSSQLTVGITANVPAQSVRPIQPSESIETYLYLQLYNRCINLFGFPTSGSFCSCVCLEPSLLGAPFRRDNSFSEADGDGKRRYPILNPSQDMRYRGSAEPPLLSIVPQKPSILRIPSQGGWLVEDDLNKGQMGSRSPGIFQESDASRYAKQRGHQNFLSQGATSMVLQTYASTGKNGEVLATASLRNS